MKQSKTTYLAILAAVAGLPLLAATSFGQQMVGGNGHALDANPQVGSGGINTNSSNPAGQGYQNALVTGNVTGGFGFRGRTVDGVDLGVGYSDPFAFRGLLAGQGVDQFIANSTGVPTMASPMAASQKYSTPSTVYYGQSNHVQPSGFQPLPGALGFVPDQPTERSPSDTRLGAVDFSQSPTLPKPDELLLPGPVDPTAPVNPSTASQLFAASPLYGVRQWSFGPQNAQTGTDQQSQLNMGSSLYGSQSPLQQGMGTPQNQTADQARLMQIRQELNNINTPNRPGGTDQPDPGAIMVNSRTDPGAIVLPSQTGDNILGASNPPNPSLGLGGGYDTSVSDQMAQSDKFSTHQSTRQVLGNIPVPPPSQQSTQYLKLQQSLEKYNSAHPMTDEEANREFQNLLHLRQQAAANAEQGAGVLGAPKTVLPANNAGGSIPAPEGNETSPNAPAGNLPNPELNHRRGEFNSPGITTMPSLNGLNNQPGDAPSSSIDSFANGIRAKGLADLIVSGEMFVQKQQYDRAIAKYNDAIEVAPNNPLILMGRANAELGGGYYAQANADLHNAIAQNPAILMGRYDLQVHLGAATLKSLTADLKQISEQSTGDSTHAFLLAYVLYNSHRVGKAAEWLDAADKRSGGHDQAIFQMKKYWNFNEDQDAPTTRPAANRN